METLSPLTGGGPPPLHSSQNHTLRPYLTGQPLTFPSDCPRRSNLRWGWAEAAPWMTCWPRWRLMTGASGIPSLPGNNCSCTTVASSYLLSTKTTAPPSSRPPPGRPVSSANAWAFPPPTSKSVPPTCKMLSSTTGCSKRGDTARWKTNRKQKMARSAARTARRL